MTKTNEWLLVPEAAVYIQMHPDTLRERFRRGEIRGCKTGKTWRTKREWLDAYLLESPMV